MNKNEQYVVQSLELHLFFARIMKEHSFFLKAGFTPVDESFAKEAEFYKNEFEKLLSCAVSCSSRIISCNTLDSGELFTEFTPLAEIKTERFTGISICKSITVNEQRLCCSSQRQIDRKLFQKVHGFNQMALRLLGGLISFKERILDRVLKCQMFTLNYPLLIEHIIREAKLYQNHVRCLETKGHMDVQSERQIEQFWNRIMMEHALFIRGLLDPSENELIDTADEFAKDYQRLLQKCCEAQDRAFAETRSDVLAETEKFRDFKAAGAKGIQDCKIRSIILPLLADHVLREANHYIRLLKHC